MQADFITGPQPAIADLNVKERESKPDERSGNRDTETETERQTGQRPWYFDVVGRALYIVSLLCFREWFFMFSF